jgi:hypothetical protein
MECSAGGVGSDDALKILRTDSDRKTGPDDIVESKFRRARIAYGLDETSGIFDTPCDVTLDEQVLFVPREKFGRSDGRGL